MKKLESKKNPQNEERDFSLNLNSWKYSFSYLEHPSLLFSHRRTRSKEDYELAIKFCPRLYVDPKLFKKERGIIARNLGIKGIPIGGIIGAREKLRLHDHQRAIESIFHLFPLQQYIFNFNKDLRKAFEKNNPISAVLGANIWLLSRLQEILNRVKKEKRWLENNYQNKLWRKIDTDRLNLLNEMEELLSEVNYSEPLIRRYIKSLFLEIFPKISSHTCVIKFNVIHHPKDSKLICIQYFFYWPIQVLPHHFFDYEPVYVYLYKTKENEDPNLLSVAYNSVPSIWATREVILSLFRKRIGHLIRIFFNYSFEKKHVNFLDQDWGTHPLCYAHDEFNKVANFMTEAYGGQYVYEELPEDIEKSHVKQLLDEDGHIALCIPNSMGNPVFWHAFDLCSTNIRKKKEWRIHPNLVPLNCHDLLHIEWNIDSPFQAPFLYPVVGGKNPRMHTPFNFRDLMVHECHSPEILVGAWHDFCDHNWEFPGDEKIAIFRLGRIIEFLYNKQRKNPKDLVNMWQKIKDCYVNYSELSSPEWYYSHYDSHYYKDDPKQIPY